MHSRLLVEVHYSGHSVYHQMFVITQQTSGKKNSDKSTALLICY